MKMNDATLTVQKNDIDSQKAFTIKASAKAFQILSEGLYSNKIAAPIRELSTNAYDAHVQAGKKDLPFLVHLPNRFEPFFSIRDYGTGLSENDILHVYTTYFDSTKTNSNDSIGCLGLGSKSPFALVDNFNVTSFFGGQKKIYLVYINEDGCPYISKVSEEDSTEENGLEVKFVVKNEQISAFEHNAVNIYQHFPVQPTLVGSSVKIIQKQHKVTGTKWGMSDSSQLSANYGARNIKAIMGNIAYIIDSRDLDNGFSNWFNFDLDMYFDIGELDIAPSREKLSYTKSTTLTIQNRLGLIKKELQVFFEKQLLHCKSLWEAQLFLNECRDLNRQIIGFLGGVTFNGQSIKPQDWIAFQGKVAKTFSATSSGSFRKEESENAIRVSKQTIIIEADPQEQAITLAKRFLISHNIDKLNWSNVVKYLYVIDDATTKKSILDLGFPIDKIINSKTLPIIKRLVTKTSVYIFNGGTSLRSWKDCWRRDVKFDLSQGGIYFELDGYKVNSPSQFYHRPYSLFDNMAKNFKAFEIQVPTIIGVNSITKKQIENNPLWMSAQAYFVQQLKNQLIDAKFIEKVNFYNAFKPLRETLGKSSSILRAAGKHGDCTIIEMAHNKFDQISSAMHDMMQSLNYYNVPELLQRLPTISDYEPNYFTNLYKKIVKRYPLINKFNDIKDNDMHEYMSMCDYIHDNKVKLS